MSEISNAQKRRGPVNPASLLAQLTLKHREFGKRRQQDAHDFMCKLFEECGEGLRKCFEVGLEWSVRCGRCRQVSRTTEKTTFLSLPIAPHDGSSEDEDVLVKELKRMSLRKEGVSVKCLLRRHFSHPSVLHKDNQYYCEECKSKQDAAQSVRLQDSTNTHLIVHLQRYTADCRKQSVSVAPDPRLTLHGRCFELTGAVVHLGSTLECGHYVAYLVDGDSSSDGQGGGVVRVSDATVGHGDAKDLLDCYILFYRLAPAVDDANYEQYNSEDDSVLSGDPLVKRHITVRHHLVALHRNRTI
jgi:uncharacterized UBP type Zn finger protein